MARITVNGGEVQVEGSTSIVGGVANPITLDSGVIHLHGPVTDQGIFIDSSNTLYSPNIDNGIFYSGAEYPMTIVGGGNISGANNTIIGGAIGPNSTVRGSLIGGSLSGGSLPGDVTATVSSITNETILGPNAYLVVDSLYSDSFNGSFSGGSIIGGSVTGGLTNSSISGSSISGGTIDKGTVTAPTEVLETSTTSTDSDSTETTTADTPSVDTTPEQVIDLSIETSGNGSWFGALKRMELVYGDISIKFAINPSDYNQKEPNRATITQTKGGAWIDAWGAGITEFSIKGITGVSGIKTDFKTTINNQVHVGYSRWVKLRDLFRTVYKAIQDGEPVTELIQLYNYTDNEFWYCYPTSQGIELYRSKSKPHVYQYTISLWGLRRIGEPEATEGKIGNPYKEQATINPTQTPDRASTEAMPPTDTQTPTDNPNPSNPENPTETEDGEDLGATPPTLEEEAVTTTDIEAAVSGGVVYTSGSIPIDTEADVSIRVYTRTKSVDTIRQESENYLKAMQDLIGGTEDGRIVPATGYHVAEDLNIAQQGTVLNITPIKATNLDKFNPLPTDFNVHRLMKELHFQNLVSPNTYELQTRIKEFDPTVLSPEYVFPIGSTPKERVQQAVNNNLVFGSTIYKLVSIYRSKYYLSKVDTRYIKAILLESIYVYRELYNIVNSNTSISTTLSVKSMKVLIRNINTIIRYLEINTLEDHMFYISNLMWELRQLQYLMVQVLADVVIYV